MKRNQYFDFESMSVETLFRRWYHAQGRHQVSHEKLLQRFEVHVLPGIGHLPFIDVTYEEWRAIFRSTARKVAVEVFGGVQYMRHWAIGCGLLPRTAPRNWTRKNCRIARKLVVSG